MPRGTHAAFSVEFRNGQLRLPGRPSQPGGLRILCKRINENRFLFQPFLKLTKIPRLKSVLILVSNCRLSLQ